MKNFWNKHSETITFLWEWTVQLLLLVALILATLAATLYAIGRG